MTEQEEAAGSVLDAEEAACEQVVEEPAAVEEMASEQVEKLAAVEETAPEQVEEPAPAGEATPEDAVEEPDSAQEAASEQTAEPEQDEAAAVGLVPETADNAEAEAEAAFVAADEEQPKKRKLGLKVALGAVAALVVATGCLTGWMYADDSDRVQHVPDNTMLDGAVDISGMTHEEVEGIVQKRAALGYSSQTNLVVDGKSFSIKLSDVGNLDVEKTADQAFAPYENESFFTRGLKAIVSGESDVERNVATVCEVDNAKLKERVKKIAKKVDCDAQDASYYYDSSVGTLIAAKAKNGIKVNQKKTRKALRRALENPSGNQQVKASAKVTKPDVEHSGQAIFVDTGACELYLYEDGDQVIEWPCSPGQDGYATPKGDWYLSYKDPSPTWYNPHAEWSVGMPDVWEPGADNPLGLRALAVSCGDGIFIHGTINYGALGTRDSHGCVRLANENIVELYDRVSEGIPIIIR